MLPFREARDEDDEKHVHPLQLDVIERLVDLYSNPGETVLTPFMGVGSEAFGAVLGTAARKPPHVVCSSTLRIEPAGPNAWSLVCEGGR